MAVDALRQRQVAALPSPRGCTKDEAKGTSAKGQAKARVINHVAKTTDIQGIALVFAMFKTEPDRQWHSVAAIA